MGRSAGDRAQIGLLLAPAAVAGLVFVILPTLGAFGLSLFDWDFMSPPRFVGLAKWQQGIASQGVAESLKATLLIMLMVIPASMALGLLQAVLVNSIGFLKAHFRAILFAPFVASLVAVSFVWRDMFATQDGLLNYLMTSVGLPPVPWLTDAGWARVSVSIVSVWQQSGYCMLIYLARLQGINPELYDAAEIDGANWFQTFTRITVPQVSPATFFLLIIGVISSLQVFESVYVITGGGPGYATTTMVYFIYQVTFQNFDVGLAGVMSVLLIVMIGGVTAVLWQLQKKMVSYDA